MSDYALPLVSTLVCGMSSSGKTTFAIRYLLNVCAACRFIYDDDGQMAARLRIRPCFTASELEAALATRWVVFNPLRMFPDDMDGAAFRFFCQWVFDASCRGPGKKVVLVDEVWQYCSPHSIPPELGRLSRRGRVEGIELLSATQSPQRLNEVLIGQATEAVFFRLDEANALDKVDSISRGKLRSDEIANLPLGKFISLNRLSGQTLSGSVF